MGSRAEEVCGGGRRPAVVVRGLEGGMEAVRIEMSDGRGMIDALLLQSKTR